MRTLLQSCALLSLVIVAAAQDGPPPEDAGSGLRLRTEEATEGYTLIAPLQSGSTFLLDMEGEVVHRWKTGLAPGNAVSLLPSGNLLRCVRVEDNEPFRGGGIGGRLQELAPDGSVVWDYSLATEEYHHHHDIEVLPSGNVLAIVWERLTRERAIELGRDPEATADDGLWVDAVYEIEPLRPDGGKIVWSWSAADHLVQDFSEEAVGFDEVPLVPGRVDINADHRDRPPETAAQRRQREEMERKMKALGYVGDDGDDVDSPQGGRKSSDWMHSNSVDYHAGLDLIALSVRTLGEVWIIDHSTTGEEAAGSSGGNFGRGGEILYRWGNPRHYGMAGARQLFGQHDATFVEGPEGALHLLVYNNGSGRPGDVSYSSVVEIALPFDAEGGFQRASGQAFGPAEPFWEYTAPRRADFYSSFISGAQRLWSGNTLVAEGATGRIFEVTRGGEMVWELVNPHGGELKRRGGRGGGPGRGGPRGDGPPPGRGDRGDRGGRRGPPMAKGAMFRAQRLAPEDPGVKALFDRRQ